MRFTRETLKRALRTFIQAFLAYIAVNVTFIDFGAEKAVIRSALTGLAVSAVASGLAAIMNLEGKNDDTNGEGD